MMPATQIKQGMVVVHNGELFKVVQTTHVAPGNWRAMVQTKMRNLRTGSQIEHRFNANETVERAILDQHEMEFLYKDGDHYHFMNTENYEQVVLNAEVLDDYSKYLLPNCHIQVDFYEEKAVAIELPQNMTFLVIEADPSVKRATASAQFKNATIETGVVVRVPAFIEAGDKIVINTETGDYVERA